MVRRVVAQGMSLWGDYRLARRWRLLPLQALQEPEEGKDDGGSKGDDEVRGQHGAKISRPVAQVMSLTGSAALLPLELALRACGAPGVPGPRRRSRT